MDKNEVTEEMKDKLNFDEMKIEDMVVLPYPHPILRKKCEPVEEFDITLQSIVNKMFHLMNSNRSIGLAAPQAGLPLRIFVYNHTPDDISNNSVIINPKLEDLQNVVLGEEGCLSFPGIYTNVKRANRGTLKGVDVDGKEVSFGGVGLLPRIWQHEIDHLNGKLMIDHQNPSDTIRNKKQIKSLEIQAGLHTKTKEKGSTKKKFPHDKKRR